MCSVLDALRAPPSRDEKSRSPFSARRRPKEGASFNRLQDKASRERPQDKASREHLQDKASREATPETRRLRRSS